MNASDFASYADMVAAALVSETMAQPFYAWLRAKNARNTAERDILRAGRRTHPGRTNYELLAPHVKMLNAQFPVHEWAPPV